MQKSPNHFLMFKSPYLNSEIMSIIYLKKREPRIVQAIKITDKAVSIASLKVATHSQAQITDEILEYIPKNMALEFFVALQHMDIEVGHSQELVKQQFLSNDFVDTDHYLFAQIETHYIETPDNSN